MDVSGFETGQEAFRPALGVTQPPINGYRDSFPRVERRERDVDHSHASRAEVKNGVIPVLFLYVLVTWARTFYLAFTQGRGVGGWVAPNVLHDRYV